MSLLVACLLCMCAAAPAFAEEALTWDDCLREAKQHNPDLLAAEAVVRKAKADYFGSYSVFLPQVSANLSRDQGTSKTPSSSSTLDSNSAGLSADETLFNGFKNVAEVRQQRAALDSAEAALTLAKAQVGADLKSAFAQLLFAQEQVALAQNIAGRRQENARLIELRYHAGREHEGSYLRSRASAQQANFEIEQAQRALEVAQQQLAKVFGRKTGDALSVTGTFVTVTVGGEPDFDALLTRTPAHRQADADAQSAKAGVTVARSDFFPTVSATGSLSREGADWPLRDERWLIGMVVSLPLFSGGHTVFNVRSATAERDRVLVALKSVDNNTKLSLKEAFAALRDAAGKVDVQREFLHAAQVRDEIATSQYTAGLLSFQDWDLIEDDLIANQKTMLTSQRDALSAEATWERTQGKSPLP